MPGSEEEGKYLSQKWLLTTIVTVLVLILSSIASFYHITITSNSREVLNLKNRAAYSETRVKEIEQGHKEFHREQLSEMREFKGHFYKEMEELKRKLLGLEWQLARLNRTTLPGESP